MYTLFFSFRLFLPVDCLKQLICVDCFYLSLVSCFIDNFNKKYRIQTVISIKLSHRHFITYIINNFIIKIGPAYDPCLINCFKLNNYYSE